MRISSRLNTPRSHGSHGCLRFRRFEPPASSRPRPPNDPSGVKKARIELVLVRRRNGTENKDGPDPSVKALPDSQVFTNEHVHYYAKLLPRKPCPSSYTTNDSGPRAAGDEI
jgi:hypothetical protein